MYRFWLHVVLVICATRTESEILFDCVGCKNDQPELNEFLKSQKIAHRLEYIKQQLISNLHVENPPKESSKFNLLPDFLVHQLVGSNVAGISSGYAEDNDQILERQMVLFAEEEKADCYGNAKNSICLVFKLSEEILSADLSSAAIWFYRKFVPLGDSRIHNFTIIDKTTLNTKNRYSRNFTFFHIKDNDGWYQIDITALVKSWQFYNQVNKHRTLSIICDTCNVIEHMVNATQHNNKVSFLLLNTDSEQSARSKRGVECVTGKDECCREDLLVDFGSLGEEYKMVLNPAKFNAYVCRGNCYLQSATDAHKPYATLLVMLKLRRQSEYSLPATCCTPTKFSSLQVLYASDDLTIKKTSIPNMIVESCGCI